MQCCLNSNLPKKMLEKADQIKFLYKDKNSILDYIQYEKTIVLDCLNVNIDWEQIQQLNVLSKNNFLLCLSSIEDAKIANSYHIAWYWGFPVSSMYTAKGLKELGSTYLILDAPLFFDYERIKKLLPEMKFRHTPNIAYKDGLPRENGVHGTWIRPEDLDLYEPYIDIIEFENCTREQESILYQIYMEDKKWNVLLDLLITNLNYSCTNRLISADIGEKRLKCRQICEYGGACTICLRALYLADPERLQKLKDVLSKSSHTFEKT